MRIKFTLCFFTWLCATTCISAPLTVSYIGSPKAKNKVIYLHGADTAAPGPGEEATRIGLNQLAVENDLYIALPRSKTRCPAEVDRLFGGQPSYCWEGNAIDHLQAIQDSLSEDFQSSFGVIGFSTGGRLANAWMLKDAQLASSSAYFYTEGKKQALNFNPLWFISVACADAGDSRFVGPSDTKERFKNVIFVLGTHEFQRGFNINPFFCHLFENRYPMRRFDFDGGHIFPITVVGDAIKEISAQ